MANSYDEVMKHIEVTVEMQDRIINNINNINLEKTPRKYIYLSNYRKYLSISASLVILFISILLLQKSFNILNLSPVGQSQEKGGIIDYTTISKLSEVVGFTVKQVTNIPFDVDKVRYSSYWGELAEVEYMGNSNIFVLRMAVGNEDISGNYLEYESIKNIRLNGYDIVVKGNNENYNLAIWQNNGYSYALQFTEAISEQEILACIESVQ